MNPVTGKITSPFGTRIHPITRKQSFHSGVDIAVREGTDVKAPADGKIVDVWEDPMGGLSVSMITPDRVRYGFAHLKCWLVKEGQQVHEGEVIALSGMTGRATGPHLHFSMKINGIAEDPQKHFDFRS